MTAQIGNHLGVAARGGGVATPTGVALAVVTANPGASLFTVSAADVRKFFAGQAIDVYSSAGTLRAWNRGIITINLNGQIGYDQGDVAAIVAGDVVVTQGTIVQYGSTNLNGGGTNRRGLELRDATSIEGMRRRLFTLNFSYYTAARLDTMTYNDLMYALRLSEAPNSI